MLDHFAKSAFVVTSVLALAVGACSSKPSPDDFTRSEIDRIVSKCGVERSRVLLNQGSVTIIAPAENDPVGNCTLSEIKRTGKRHVSIVANELHERPRP